jgi:pilus assembly protein CpaC
VAGDVAAAQIGAVHAFKENFVGAAVDNGDGVSADMRVVSSDANARFLALGVSKSVVVELSADVKSIVVADRTIATAVALSKRRPAPTAANVAIVAAKSAVRPSSLRFISAPRAFA